MTTHDAFRGRTALVTGASGGIGEALALGLAESGADVVLVARSTDALEALAASIRQRHGVQADVLTADLATTEGVDHVIDSLRGRRIDALVANAGVGGTGPFVEASDERITQQIALNVTAVTRLVRAFLPGMVDRGVGGVLTVASTASFQPTPDMAVYGATKAFVLSFTEALWDEVRGTGVRVLALCPGPTSTGFFAAAGDDSTMSRGRQTSEQVASVGLRALARRGGPSVVSGAANVLTASAHRFVPRSLMVRMSGIYMRGD